MTPRILIIAGSDSGGGAGIQADIKTVTMLGGHAMTAITAITAQNTIGVQAVHPVPTDIVVAQMRSCIDDIGVDAIKIGMIGSAETAHAVADVLEELRNAQPSPLPEREGPGVGGGLAIRVPTAQLNRTTSTPPTQCSGGPCPRHGPEMPGGHFDPNTPSLSGKGAIPIVFDPVMVATSGATLADAATVAAFERLMTLAAIVTPNLPELAALGGEAAVLALTPALLVKGGHAEGDLLADRLVTREGEQARWEHTRIATTSTHGTGCTLASAIATGLGAGLDLPASIERAIAFVRASLLAAPGLGQGHGPMGQQFATGFQCPA